MLQKLKNFFLWPKKEWQWWIRNWKQDLEFRKQLLAIILGFGIAGLIWGGALYYSYHDSTSPFILPFILDGGAIPLAILGGLGLGYAFFRNNKRKIILLVLLGLPAWFIAFLVPAIFREWLLWGGGIFLFPLYLAISYYSDIIGYQGSLIDLKPSLVVGSLWLGFLLLGISIILFLATFFKRASKKFLLFPSLFLAFSSLIFPLIFNLVYFYLFHSLFLVYLLTFVLITLTFALSLFKAIKYEAS